MSTETVTLPDTNTILRYLLKDHPELSIRATEYWESVREGHTIAFMTEGVLMECVYVLQRFYKVPREKIARELGVMLAYKGLKKEGLSLYSKSLEIYGTRNLDFVDCLLAAQELAGIGTVFSFDKKLNKNLGNP